MGHDTKVWYINIKEIVSVVGTLGIGAGYLWWLFHQGSLLDEEENERRRQEREASFLFKAKRKVNRALIEKFNLD